MQILTQQAVVSSVQSPSDISESYSNSMASLNVDFDLRSSGIINTFVQKKGQSQD